MREFSMPACLLAVVILSACATAPPSGDQPGSRSGPSTAAKIAALDNATPGHLTLLATLEHELSIARRHGDYAARRPEDVHWIQTHLRHLRHALDPGSERDGPGLGYGVVRAASLLGHQMGAIIAAADTARRIRHSARGARASLANVVGWADEVLILSANALTEPRLSPRLLAWLRVINQRLTIMETGVDSDHDHRISPKLREGGVTQARSELRLVLERKRR